MIYSVKCFRQVTKDSTSNETLATLTGARKLIGKNLNFIHNFLNLYFAPRTTISCNAASTQRQQRPYLMQGGLRQHDPVLWQNCGTVFWHNTRVRHCDRTRTLTCRICKISSFSRYNRVSQPFSDHVPFQHFDRWACTPNTVAILRGGLDGPCPPDVCLAPQFFS